MSLAAERSRQKWQSRHFICESRHMHVAIYLASGFYAAIASTAVETFQTVNELRGEAAITWEFISKDKQAISKSGVSFTSRRKPLKKMDVLILLAGAKPRVEQTVDLLQQESKRASPIIELALSQRATLAATCGAAFMLADRGLLNRKRATVAWWLKDAVAQLYPQVRWQSSRMIVRDGQIYTTGAGFAGMELIRQLLRDKGFVDEERKTTKLLVLPPVRVWQSPYEIISDDVPIDPFEKKIGDIAIKHIKKLSVSFLAANLGQSPRTMARIFLKELKTSPGRWIQEVRLRRARHLLETTNLNISEVCYAVGYEDVASFGRLFARATGLSPKDFRRHL
jgi:transcriptional regulator GlxA family with amidase domain